MKKFFKKGSAEIVSIVLGIVVIGGLALAVTGTFSQQTKTSLDAGMKAQTAQMDDNYNNAVTNGEVNDPTIDDEIDG